MSADHLLTLRLEEGAATLAAAELVPDDPNIDDIVDACRGGQRRLDVMVRELQGLGVHPTPRRPGGLRARGIHI